MLFGNAVLSFVYVIQNELVHASDYDFLIKEKKPKSLVIRKVSKTLSLENLQVNATKPEVITLKRSNSYTEEWQKIKKLDKEDIKNRKRLANIVFNKSECIWLSRRNVSIQRGVKLYSMLAKSILLYNCST